MKKVIILLLALALIVALVVILFSCGNSNNEPNNGATVTETSEPTPMETPAPTPTPETTEPPTPTPEPMPIETPEPTIDNETPNIDHELVGTWKYFDYWDNEMRDEFVLHADATGISWVIGAVDRRNPVDITWEAENGILTIFAPNAEAHEFEYEIDGGSLFLTGFDGHVTLTRVE